MEKRICHDHQVVSMVARPSIKPVILPVQEGRQLPGVHSCLTSLFLEPPTVVQSTQWVPELQQQEVAGAMHSLT